MCQRLTIGYELPPDSLRKWRDKLFKQIAKHTNKKPKKMQITFDCQRIMSITIIIIIIIIIIMSRCNKDLCSAMFGDNCNIPPDTVPTRMQLS